MNAFTKWLDTLVEEKEVNLDSEFEVEGASGTNFMSYGVIVEAIKGTSPAVQAAIKNNLVKIDFCNGDIKHYFRHLGKALAI